MNSDTGELRSMLALQEMPSDFERIPKNLNHAAKCKLRGKSKAMVSLTSGGRLSRWAASKRKKKKQLAKANRRRNRHA